MNSGKALLIIDTGAANIHSVAKAVRVAGAEPRISREPQQLLDAHAAILPGVGANDAVMRSLNAQPGLTDAIRAFASRGRPILCVCIGMQVLMDRSDEGSLPGLGIIPGTVKRLEPRPETDGGAPIKIPHMGWNSIAFRHAPTQRHPMFRHVDDGAHFYFVHSYHCVPDDPSDIAATTDYGAQVCAAIVRDNIVGTQFHPEKSGRAGVDLYARFIQHAASIG